MLSLRSNRCAAVALLLLVAALAGCGESDHARRAADKAATGNAAGGSAALPADFPRDVPILAGATVKLALSQSGRSIVHLYATASPADAAKFYAAELKRQGWTIESTTGGGEMFVVSAKKGRSACGVTVSKEGKRTLVRLAVTEPAS
jgi:hypothetical protein